MKMESQSYEMVIGVLQKIASCKENILEMIKCGVVDSLENLKLKNQTDQKIVYSMFRAFSVIANMRFSQLYFYFCFFYCFYYFFIYLLF